MTSQSSIKDKEREVNVVKEKIEKLKTKITKLLELHENNQIEKELFNEFHKPPIEQLKQLEQTILTLESEIKILKEHAKSSHYILTETKSLYENWNTLSNEENQNEVETITKDIIVEAPEVSINLYSACHPKKVLCLNLLQMSNMDYNSLLVFVYL